MIILNDYPRHVIDNSIGLHVVGAVQTNKIEGFSSLIKRGIGLHPVPKTPS